MRFIKGLCGQWKGWLAGCLVSAVPSLWRWFAKEWIGDSAVNAVNGLPVWSWLASNPLWGMVVVTCAVFLYYVIKTEIADRTDYKKSADAKSEAPANAHDIAAPNSTQSVVEIREAYFQDHLSGAPSVTHCLVTLKLRLTGQHEAASIYDWTLSIKVEGKTVSAVREAMGNSFVIDRVVGREVSLKEAMSRSPESLQEIAHVERLGPREVKEGWIRFSVPSDALEEYRHKQAETIYTLSFKCSGSDHAVSIDGTQMPWSKDWLRLRG